MPSTHIHHQAMCTFSPADTGMKQFREHLEMPDNGNKTHKTAPSATLVSHTAPQAAKGDKDDWLDTWSK